MSSIRFSHNLQPRVCGECKRRYLSRDLGPELCPDCLDSYSCEHGIHVDDHCNDCEEQT